MVQHVVSPDRAGVVSSDESVQAVIKMWDDNLLILGVDKKLSKKLKRGDFVIADYTPMAAESPNRKMLIIKILPESDGNKIWGEFQDELEKKRAQQMSFQQMSQQRMR